MVNQANQFKHTSDVRLYVFDFSLLSTTDGKLRLTRQRGLPYPFCSSPGSSSCSSSEALRPGLGFASRPRLRVPAPASRPGFAPRLCAPASRPGFAPRLRAPASRPGFAPRLRAPASRPGFAPRLRVPAPASRPGFTPRPHATAPASSPGPGFKSRPRLHVPAPASRPGPGFTSRPRLLVPVTHPGPSYGPLPPSLVLFLGRLASVP
uniref:Uncharacterized protein n=1 Tax=Knipowitschia caucasica TaxID=637954 RepID=A0AAV2KNS8_KNICA